MTTKAILSAFVKPLLRLTGWFSPEKAREARKRLRARGYPVFAFALILCVMLSGCVVSDYFTLAGNKWIYGEAVESTQETTEQPELYDFTAEQTLLSQSPRIGHLVIPGGMEPTITINKIDKHGKIEFSCPLFPNTKIPDGYGGDVITTNGTDTNDHMGGYMYHDSRWNKHYGDNTKQVMVVIFHDSEGVKAYSKVKDI